MESSPSSIFVLVLNNHKLIFFPETGFAPTISAFKSTAQFYINQQHKNFINERYENLKIESENSTKRDRSKSRVTKKSLWEKYPRSNLEVVPIPSELSLNDFIKRYQKLNSITIKVLRTNSEINNSKLLQSVRKNGAKLGAASGSIGYSGDKDGLDKSEAAKQLSEMALDGNSDVRLSGLDLNGNRLIGNNDEFKLKVAVDNISSNIDEAAPELYGAMNDEIESANLQFAENENSAEQLQTIAAIARQSNG